MSTEAEAKVLASTNIVSQELKTTNCDVFDGYEKRVNSGFDFLSCTIATGASIVFLPGALAAYVPRFISSLGPGIVTEGLGGFGGNGVKWATHTGSFDISKKCYSDEDLKYGAYQLQFKGNKALKIGGVELKKGDNFLFIRIPDLKIEHPPAKKLSKKGIKAKVESFPPVKLLLGIADERSTFSDAPIDLLTDLNTVVFAQLKDTFKNVDGGIVFIEAPKYSPARTRSMLGLYEIPIKKILEGKTVKLLNPERKVFAMTREEFERLAISLTDLFKKAVEALGNRKVEALVEVARRAGSSNEREENELPRSKLTGYQMSSLS